MSSQYVDQRNDEYYVAGSRVTLASVVYQFRNGASPESIVRSFPALNLLQVYRAITYYLEHQPEIDAYLLQREKDSEKFARDHPIPPALKRKIEGARQAKLVKR